MGRDCGYNRTYIRVLTATAGVTVVEGESKNVTQLEVQAIVNTAVDKAIEQQTKELPELMKPTMYEVAERVSKRGEEAFKHLLGTLFGVDLLDHEAVRKFQMDLFWLRERRQTAEAQAAALKSSILSGGLRAVGLILTCVLLSVLAAVGLKVVGI